MPGSSNEKLLCARCHAELEGNGQREKKEKDFLFRRKEDRSLLIPARKAK
jgi:hypothetical protein